MANIKDIANTLAQTQSPKKDNRANKVERIPINSPRGILDIKGKEEGFHYCWVNEDKVGRFEDAAYEYVTHDVKVGQRKINQAKIEEGSMKISMPVGLNLRAYLMRIPQELYDEDMKNLHAKVDESEGAIRSSAVGRSLQGTVDISFKKE